jgi:alpha-methylacyl-CoA racemase
VEGREGDQRHIVALRETPCLAVTRGVDGKDKDASVLGQGAGVEGDGHTGVGLEVGAGGEETLAEWAGWKKGKEYDVRKGGLILNESTKIPKL